MAIQDLFIAIHQARTEQALRQQVIPQCGKYFATTRQGLFFFDPAPLYRTQIANCSGPSPLNRT